MVDERYDFAQAGAAEGALALLDDPQEWGGFGRPCEAGAQGGLWESHVVLVGMHCAACALTVEEALLRVPGVQQAQVSGAAQRARVVWSPARVRPSEWFGAVRAAGYGALPALDALAREERLSERRRMLWRWLVAGFCMMQVMMYAWPAYRAMPGDLSTEMEQLLRWASWVISLPVLLFSCGPFFSSAWRDVRQRRISMDLPVALGMLITFVISMAGTFDPAGMFGREVYYDSFTMFVFFLLTGRWLELLLRERTVGALEAVLNRLPDSVLRRCGAGEGEDAFERVATRRLRVGDLVRVLPGEAFPADGLLVAGSTQADEALLTGESTPVPKPEGAQLTAGSYNLAASVEMRVHGTGAQTRFGQIVTLMEGAALQKPRLAQLADRVARPFLVGVLLAAALAAAWWWPSDPSHALMVAVAVLIVTCPCALSLATPVALLTAAGTLARRGVLVRNLQALEALAGVDTVVFDKTGTLTHDRLGVARVELAEDAGLTQPQALALAAQLARHSLHPASRALLAAAQSSALPGWEFGSVQETVGAGLSVWARDAAGERVQLRLGSAAHAGAAPGAAQEVVLSLERDGRVRECARFVLSEALRAEAARVVRTLRQAGVQVLLLSGDRVAAVQQIAARAGIEQAYGDCTPQDKLERLRALQAQGRRVAMVGDGLNDAPVLAGADVSLAFGKSLALAQSRSDVVVLGDNLALVLQTLLLARRALAVVRQNLCWAAGYNALTVPLAIAGYMPAWLAGLGMATSSLLVVGNAARLARAPAAAEAAAPPPLMEAA